MKGGMQLALIAAAAAGLLLSFGYTRRLGDELLARAEIDELERIPVMAEDG